MRKYFCLRSFLSSKYIPRLSQKSRPAIRKCLRFEYPNLDSCDTPSGQSYNMYLHITLHVGRGCKQLNNTTVQEEMNLYNWIYFPITRQFKQQR